MKANYRVSRAINLSEKNNYLISYNYHALNEVLHISISDLKYLNTTLKSKNSIGVWKIKNKKS